MISPYTHEYSLFVRGTCMRKSEKEREQILLLHEVLLQIMPTVQLASVQQEQYFTSSTYM